MTMTAPTTIDYATKIRDRIKTALVDIIPDDQWGAMIQAEVDRFLRPQERKSSSYPYGSERVSSGLEDAVQAVLHAETIRRVKEMLNGPEWISHWEGNKAVVSEKVASLIRENSSAIIEAWLGATMQVVVDRMRGQ